MLHAPGGDGTQTLAKRGAERTSQQPAAGLGTDPGRQGLQPGEGEGGSQEDAGDGEGSEALHRCHRPPAQSDHPRHRRQGREQEREAHAAQRRTHRAAIPGGAHMGIGVDEVEADRHRHAHDQGRQQAEHRIQGLPGRRQQGIDGEQRAAQAGQWDEDQHPRAQDDGEQAGVDQDARRAPSPSDR